MYALIVPMALVAATSGVEASDERPWWSPFGGTATLEAFVGTGTFVASDKADDPYYAATLTLDPTWAIDKYARFGLSLGLTYDWTSLVTPCHPATGPRPTAGPQEDCSDTGDPNAQRAELGDLRVHMGHDRIVDLFDIYLDGSAGLAFPTSRASRGARNVVTFFAGAGLSRKIGPVTPAFSFEIDKFFPRGNAATSFAA